MKHEELRKKLEKLNEMERGKASQVVTEVLKYLMDLNQPERLNDQTPKGDAKV